MSLECITHGVERVLRYVDLERFFTTSIDTVEFDGVISFTALLVQKVYVQADTHIILFMFIIAFLEITYRLSIDIEISPKIGQILILSTGSANFDSLSIDSLIPNRDCCRANI
jgi:hypothetical protein